MEMNDFVNIVGILAMVITWFIVAPLKEGIRSLGVSVDNLAKSLEDRRAELVKLGERMATTEKGLVDLGNEFHHFCDNCKCWRD